MGWLVSVQFIISSRSSTRNDCSLSRMAQSRWLFSVLCQDLRSQRPLILSQSFSTTNNQQKFSSAQQKVEGICATSSKCCERRMQVRVSVRSSLHVNFSEIPPYCMYCCSSYLVADNASATLAELSFMSFCAQGTLVPSCLQGFSLPYFSGKNSSFPCIFSDFLVHSFYPSISDVLNHFQDVLVLCWKQLSRWNPTMRHFRPNFRLGFTPPPFEPALIPQIPVFLRNTADQSSNLSPVAIKHAQDGGARSSVV